jgi:hypothetical protein
VQVKIKIISSVSVKNMHTIYHILLCDGTVKPPDNSSLSSATSSHTPSVYVLALVSETHLYMTEGKIAVF